jgi:hypothetical protein
MKLALKDCPTRDPSQLECPKQRGALIGVNVDAGLAVLPIVRRTYRQMRAVIALSISTVLAWLPLSRSV